MKYVSVIIMALSLIVTGWGLMEVNRHIGASSILPAKSAAANDSMTADMEKEAQAAEQAAGKLAHLQAMLAPGIASAELIAVGVPSANGKSAELVSRKLTMLYFSPNFRRAVIDGRLVRAGDELTDGSKILSVNFDNVIIKESSGKTTLSIPDDKIRIGSVHEKFVAAPQELRKLNE